MNKIQKFFIFFILFLSVAVIAYKIGDSRGYDAGFTEGYRYDCREEIAALYKRVKAQGKLVDFAQKSIKEVIRENDSLRDPSVAKKRYDDSVAASVQYTDDSLKYWKKANSYNDSLYKALGRGKYDPNSSMPFVQPNGQKSPGFIILCMTDSSFMSRPECRSGWRLR